jgi:hypothetical protein
VYNSETFLFLFRQPIAKLAVVNLNIAPLLKVTLNISSYLFDKELVKRVYFLSGNSYFFPMNKIFRILLILFGCFFIVSNNVNYAQTTYEQIYEVADQSVRDKMDDNKMNGLPILSEILITMESDFSGLSSNADAEQLTSILTNELGAKEISFTSGYTRVRFTYPVQRDIDQLKSSLNSAGFQINNTVERIYSIAK